jgi:hypothetical protein
MIKKIWNKIKGLWDKYGLNGSLKVFISNEKTQK